MPYEEYFKAASEGLLVVDRTGHILEVNPRVEELFGYSQEELVGQPVELLVPPQIGELHQIEHLIQRIRGYSRPGVGHREVQPSRPIA